MASFGLFIALFSLHCLASQDVVAQNSTGISIHTSSQNASLESTVYITCSLNRGVFSNNEIIWLKKQGNFELVLARLTNMQVRSSRYSVKYMTTAADKISTLVITDFGYEDSATYVCTPNENTNNRAIVPVVICDPAVDAEVCDCAITVGWSSPACFMEFNKLKSERDDYKKAAIALGVLFCLAIIAGFVMAFFAGRDCLIRNYQQKKEAAQRRLSMGNTNHVAITSTINDEREKLTPDLNTSVPDIEINSGDLSTRGKERQRGRRAMQQEFSEKPKPLPSDVKRPSGYSNNNNPVGYPDVTIHQGGTPSGIGARSKQPKERDDLASSGPRDTSSPALILRANHQNMYTARDDLSATPRDSQPMYHTPQSITSDIGPFRRSPDSFSPDRAAYTDVPREKFAREKDWHDPAHAPIEPRRLYFTGSGKEADGVVPNGSAAPYDSEEPHASTVI